MRLARFLPLSALACLLLASPAGAYTSYSPAPVTIKFDFGFMSGMKLTGDRHGTYTKTGFTAPFEEGVGRMQPVQASLVTQSDFRFRRGEKVFRIINSRLLVKDGRPGLAVDPGTPGGPGTLNLPRLFESKTKVKPDGEFAGLRAKRVPLVLSANGAKQFNKALATKSFKKGAKVGTVSFDLVRTIQMAPPVFGGTGASVHTATVLYDAAFVNAVKACGDRISTQVQQAEEIPAGDGAPNGGYRSNASAAYTPRTGAFSTRLSGGLVLFGAIGYAGVYIPTFPTGIERDAAGGLGAAPLDLAGGDFVPRSTATGGSFDATGVRLAISAAVSQRLAAAGCSIPAGTPFGTATISILTNDG